MARPERVDRIEAAARLGTHDGDPRAIESLERTGGIEKYDRRRRWWVRHHDEFVVALR